jgi:aminodeoxyfutalosine deaminase
MLSRPQADASFSAGMPKVSLHCHLEGTLGARRFRELASRYGIDIGARGAGPIESAYAFTEFGEFLLLFAEVCKVLRAPADYGVLAADFAQSAKAQKVRYAEVFISPSVWTFFHRDLDAAAAVAAIRQALDEAERRGGPRVELIADLTRNFGPERALATVRLAAGLRSLGVIGVGLGGDERRFPAHLFGEAYALAAAVGLRRVAHAGEADGAGSVRDAVELLGAERIGHGVRALEDESVVRLLAERQITLEICPTSNRLTGAAPSGRPHPLGELDARGVRCAIDADDPELFGTSINREFALVEAWLGREALLRFASNAIEASFASEMRKSSLRADLHIFSMLDAPT